MPKPLLLRRPSGLFVRFLLPGDVRPVWGRRFLVRSLGNLRADEARLAAAKMGYAIAQAIAVFRQGEGSMDRKSLLEIALAAAKNPDRRDYEIAIPGVLSLKADGPDDHARAMQAIEKIQGMRVVVPGLPGFAMPGTPAPVAGPMLHAALERFLIDFGRMGRAAATLHETEHTLRLFRDLIDDTPLAQIDTPHIDAFRDAMAHWPARARVMGNYKDLSPRQIVAKGRESDIRKIGVRTMDKHLDRLGVFFNEAVRRRELAHNPVDGLQLQTNQAKYEPTRRSFRPDELRTLFDPDHRARYCSADPMFFWLPLLALFTGARLNELAYLATHSLTQEAGAWGIHITTKVKNAQSRRFVPLPDRLLALGLVDYAQDIRAWGFTDLFPGGSKQAKNGPGDKVSKWFNRSYLERICKIKDADVSFHSFRHTVSTAGDQLGFTEAQMGKITGHAARSIQSKFYIDPKTVPERKAMIDAVGERYDLPALAAYRPGQFSAFFDELAIKTRHAEAAAKRAGRQGV